MVPCQTGTGCMLIIPALQRWRQGDQKSKAILGCVGSLRPGWKEKREGKEEGEGGTVVSCQQLDESSIPEGAPSLDLWGRVGTTLSLAFFSHQRSDQFILLWSGIHLVVIHATGLVSIIRCY